MVNRLVLDQAKRRPKCALHDRFDGLSGQTASLALERGLCEPGSRHLELHVLPGCFHEAGNYPSTVELKQARIIFSRSLSASCLRELSTGS
jgi:hypothetical protein